MKLKKKGPKENSQLQRVKDQIRQAVNDGVTKLELIGDYNYEYLPACGWKASMAIWEEDIDKLARSKGVYMGTVYRQMRMKEHAKYIGIREVRLEDRLHTYCIIDHDYPRTALENYAEEIRAERKAILDFDLNWNARGKRA